MYLTLKVLFAIILFAALVLTVAIIGPIVVGERILKQFNFKL
ncbi:hypothetical protein [Dyadobacter alkalitolerans]|nr:hypothetical protein [Dyadobacter alkalitolerans]